MSTKAINFYAKMIVNNGETAYYGINYNTLPMQDAFTTACNQTPWLLELLDPTVPVALIDDHTLPALGAATVVNGDLIMIINLGHFDLEETVDIVNLAELIVHEMTHVQQLRDGRLKILDDGSVIWEGAKVEVVSMDDIYRYIQQPWEIEAQNAGLAWAVEAGHFENMQDAVKHFMNRVREIASDAI